MAGNVHTHGFPELENLGGITNSSFSGAILVANGDGTASWQSPEAIGGSMWDKFQINFVDKQSGYSYLGKQEPEADAWLIIKVVTSSNPIALSYANVSNNPGYTSFDTAWAARASLTYGKVGDITLE